MEKKDFSNLEHVREVIRITLELMKLETEERK